MKFNILICSIFILILSSCSHNNDHESQVSNHAKDTIGDNSQVGDNQGHNHEDVKNQFTIYNDYFELFAEAAPFVIGGKSEILTHFSVIPGFKPLENSRVTARLIINGREDIQNLDKPTKKGIYKFFLTPEVSGIGKLVFEIESKTGKNEITIDNIKVFNDEHNAIHEADNSINSSINSTVFTKEQTWKIDFSSELPKLEPLGQVIKTTAKVQASQNDEVMLTSKTNGVVKYLVDNLLEGKSINKRKSLFKISGNDLADNNSNVRYQKAKNDFDKSKIEYERIKDLAIDKIVSENRLIDAKYQYDSSKLVFDNLKKNFSSTGQFLSSPINGFIKQLYIKNGQYVDVGQPIAMITKNKSLVLLAEVQQKFAPILHSIKSATIRKVHDDKTYSLEELNGKILSYARNANADNYLIPVSLQIENDGSFLSGSFVEIYLKTLSESNVLTIPNSALLEEQGNYFIYVQITPELFEKRSIKIGVSDGIKTEVMEGLSNEERIVSKGGIFIKLSQATGTLDAHSGHAH